MIRSTTPRYGVDAASEPNVKIMNCCTSEPPDLPSGLQMTSIAALPLTFVSSSSGMYAISLHGSKSEYLEPLEKMFCAAPTMTAMKSGVKPTAARMGSHAPGRRMRLTKMKRDTIMRMNVTVPVAVEKLPMNME